MSDAAIHRGLRDADGFVCSLTGSQWIATGYALAMTRHSLSLRGGNESERRGNPSWLEGMRTTCLFAYWFTVDRHGLSALAMTIWGKGCPRDDKVWSIVNTRGGDFRSASLYSSPPPAHPTMGFCEAKSFFDDAGPRRVSKLGFVKNPFHSNQHGSRHGSLYCCCGYRGCCCCA